MEILGVLENIGPKQSLILARLSGGPLEKTGVLQGMSGSPVYIDGRLAGAVALAFPFAKEPIAGIRPIEEMVRVTEAGRGSPPSQVARNESSLASLLAGQDLTRILPRRQELTAGDTKLLDIATPVSFAGFTRATARSFRAAASRPGPRAHTRPRRRRPRRSPHGRSFHAQARFHDQRRTDDRRHEHRRRRHHHLHRRQPHLRLRPPLPGRRLYRFALRARRGSGPAAGDVLVVQNLRAERNDGRHPAGSQHRHRRRTGARRRHGPGFDLRLARRPPPGQLPDGNGQRPLPFAAAAADGGFFHHRRHRTHGRRFQLPGDR